MANMNFGWLTPKEQTLFNRLNTPQKLQDFLNNLPQNFELKGETCMSPKRVLRHNTAHCIEGALFAAAVFWYHGRRPLLMHLKTARGDQDHVIALFKESRHYGAVSKTNHAVLRYRDAIYKNPRELALSYFNEYFIVKTGRKTMIGYTAPIDTSKFGADWLTSDKELWDVNDMLYHSRHFPIAPARLMKKLRRADKLEMKVMGISEQKRPTTDPK